MDEYKTRLNNLSFNIRNNNSYNEYVSNNNNLNISNESYDQLRSDVQKYLGR